MIRTSSHTIKFANTGKRDNLKSLRTECIRVMNIYLDYLWDSRLEWKSSDVSKTYVMDIKNENFDHPSMWSNVELEKQIKGFSTPLSARLKKCLLTSVLGKIGSALEKQRKRKYIINKLTDIKSPVSNGLIKKYRQNKPVKPDLSNSDIELTSICAEIITDSTCKDFDCLINLKCLGSFKKITIPIKYHRQSNKLRNDGWELKKSVLLKEKGIDLRWEKESPSKVSFGEIVGIDQGLKDVLTLSNGAKTQKTDIHGHSLDLILHKMARKKKGSHSFKRAQEHRKNFIGWNINQINFTGIKQVNLEKIVNINFRHNTSRVLKHWTNTLIRDKVKDVCEKQGVLVREQSSTYRSQRCSVCGMVRKANRKNKEYNCKNCGNVIDADLNASLNHKIELPDIPFALRRQELNRTGFFWKPDGVFNLAGQEFTVSAYQNKT